MQRMSNKMRNMRTLVLMLFAAISLSVSAQTITLNGSVKDTSGDPIIGASIVEKGNTANGTITDLDGNFNLKVSPQATVIISYIGMKTQEIALKGQRKINVTLSDDSQALEEVIVIGYGTAKRKDITGSVATVGSDVLAAIPVSSAAEAMTGKLAGVQITSTEGSPDAEIKIRVRGGGSITGDNTPLFIVDGFPVESINDIPASEIEDITVLKDASSTAIYGARGANGVIIVTTKSGKEGKLSVNYNAYLGYKKIANTLNVLESGDYAQWQYELFSLRDNLSGYTSTFGNYQDIDLYNNIATNDWQEQIYGRTGNTFNHNLSITGGTEKIKYAASYSHINEKAIMQGSNFRRDNLSLKLSHKMNKRITVDLSIRYADTKINGAGVTEQKQTSSADSRLKHSIIYPTIPLGNLLDSNVDDSNFQLYNPLVSLADNDRSQRRKSYNMSGSLAWEIIDNLRFKTEVGIDDYRNEDNRFYGRTTYYVKNVPGTEAKELPAAVITNSSRNSFRNTNTLNYDFKKIIGDKHHLNVLIGQEMLKTDSKDLTNTLHGFPSEFKLGDALKLTPLAKEAFVNNFYNTDDNMVSFFSRVNYDYKSNYIFSATMRADGSSKFSKSNRWGYFPSAAVAWRVSSEPFMQATKSWLDDLKIRFSYGTAGNNNIPSGQVRQVFASNSTTWINGTNYYLAASKDLANPKLKWETTITRNIGLDYTLLEGRLNGSLEFYLNSTKDLLIKFPVAGSGYDYQYRNMGETQNKGLEFSLNYNIINKKNYGLSLAFNIGFNKNKIKSLGIMNDFYQASDWAGTEIGEDFRVAVGGQVGEMYGYRNDGRYEVSDFESYTRGKWILKQGVVDCTPIIGTLRPGSMKLKNVNGSEDNVVNSSDREVIGNANPVHTGGLTLNGRVYGFDISAAFNWSYGNDVYNANKIEYTSSSKYSYRNMTDEMAAGNRWTNLNIDGNICNDPAQLADMNQNTSMWSPYMKSMVFSDWAVEDGSFLRLNTLTLGYTLPTSLVNKVKIQNLRFYITGYNLFCWTNYSGFDPEVSTRRNTALTPGVDYSAYPKSRSFNVGLNLSF